MKLVIRLLLIATVIVGFFGPGLLRSGKEAATDPIAAASPQPPVQTAPAAPAAQAESATAATPSLPTGGGRFLETIYDLGRVTPYAGMLTAQFAAVNDGTSPVRLLNMIPDCGCARTEFVASPLEPRQAAVCTVYFDPSAKLGKVEVGVRAMFDDAPDRIVQLRLRCDVVDAVTITPRALDFGTYSQSRGAQETIEIRNMTAEPLQVLLQDYPEALDVAFATDPIAPPNGSIALRISIPPTTEQAASIDGQIRLAIGAEELPAIISIKGQAASSAIEVSPSRIGLGFVRSGESEPRRITLRFAARDGIPFQIEGFDCDGWDITSSPAASPGADPAATATVELAFTPAPSLTGAGATTSELVTRIKVDGVSHIIHTPVRAFIEATSHATGS